MCKNNLISLSSTYSRRYCPNVVPPVHSVVEVLSSEEVCDDGVVIQQSKYISDDSAHRYDGMKASDFALTNLLAAGANLKPAICTLNSFEAVGYAAESARRLSEFASNIKTD